MPGKYTETNIKIKLEITSGDIILTNKDIIVVMRIEGTTFDVKEIGTYEIA